jgi:hypothetical protein
MIRKISFLLFALFVFIALLDASAQVASPLEYWNKSYGGSYGDGAWAVQNTLDNGYIIAGYTSSFGQRSDLWLLKIDSLGEIVWDKVFGGSGEDVGYSVRQTKEWAASIFGF